MDIRMKSMDDFGPWLKGTMVEKKLKQRDIAESVGVSDVCVSRWVNGERFPNRKQIDKILKTMDCHMEIISNN